MTTYGLDYYDFIQDVVLDAVRELLSTDLDGWLAKTDDQIIDELFESHNWFGHDDADEVDVAAALDLIREAHAAAAAA